jgi:hypothetical protein
MSKWISPKTIVLTPIVIALGTAYLIRKLIIDKSRYEKRK